MLSNVKLLSEGSLCRIKEIEGGLSKVNVILRGESPCRIKKIEGGLSKGNVIVRGFPMQD